MSLYDRFELLNLDRDDGVKTFEAREISTGRPVKVHLFVHAAAPLQVALLKAIERLPGEERQRVLDRGKHEGTPYVVTDRLIDYPGLSEWVQAASRPGKPDPTGAEAGRAEPARPEAAKPDAAKPSKAVLETAGAWKLPQTPPAAKGSPASLNQQFAELFPTAERPVLLPETVILPPPATKPLPASGPPPAAQLSTPPQAPASAHSSAPPPPPPGEFTRMFQSPMANQAPPPPSSAPVSNDFERFFEPTAPAGPMPRSPVVQQPLTPQAPGNAGPNKVGEFTRMFGKGDLGAFAAPPAAPPPPKEPGEFTRMFQSPVAPPTPAAPPAASPASGAPSVGAPSFPAPSFAAPSFSPPPAAPPYSPPPAANPSLAKPAGPGEYTRQFSAPAPMTLGQPVVQPAGTPPAAPPATPGIQPSAFAAPAAPAMTAPAPPPPQKNNLPLILGVAAIVVVAIIIVVIFALRPK